MDQSSLNLSIQGDFELDYDTSYRHKKFRAHPHAKPFTVTPVKPDPLIEQAVDSNLDTHEDLINTKVQPAYNSNLDTTEDDSLQEEKLVKQEPSNVGKMAFVCSMCGKKFLHKSTLKRHMKEHDPDAKRFTCMVCRKNHQLQRSNWIQHVATHFGEKIPQAIFQTFDQETRDILNGDHEYMTAQRRAYRLARLETKKKATKKGRLSLDRCQLDGCSMWASSNK